MDALFTSSCQLCGADVASDAPSQLLCCGCRTDLPRVGAQCLRCACALGVTGICGDCLRLPPPIQRTSAALRYGFPVDRLIWKLKFERRIELAAVFAELLFERVLEHSYEHLGARIEQPATAAGVPELLIPVPMHRWRMLWRGFNQAQEIARHLSRRTGIALATDLVNKPRATAAQSDLSRAERIKNLRGAYCVAPGAQARLSDRYVAIVDDVMTTGATTRSLAATLLAAGARAVDVWVCCRA